MKKWKKPVKPETSMEASVKLGIGWSDEQVTINMDVEGGGLFVVPLTPAQARGIAADLLTVANKLDPANASAIMSIIPSGN